MLIIFTDQAHLVLSVPYLPPVLVKAKSVVDVELRGERKLFDIYDFHKQLGKVRYTSKMMRLLVWM